MIGHKRVLFPLNRLIPALIPSRQYSNEDDEPIVFNRLNRWLSQLWWVKCILRYISQERGGGTNHKDTKDTKIDRSYVN